MSDILIIKNISREGPGLLEHVLAEELISYDIIDLNDTTVLPALNNYKALIVLGGPDSANDNTIKIKNELAYVKEVLNNNIPYLGICLGLQILVKAAGGKVVKGKAKEIGFSQNNINYTVELTKPGKSDPIFKNLQTKLQVFQLHGETVELTPNMQLLATSKDCTNQIVKIGNNAYGIQSHFELTQEMLNVWAKYDPDLIPIGASKLNTEFLAIKTNYSQIGKTLFKNFINIASLTK